MLCDIIARDHPEIDDYKLVSPGKFARFEGVESPLVCTSRIEGLDVRIDDNLRREDFENKPVIIVDDITLTATTILRVGTAIRQLNPRYLFLALPHVGTEAALNILRGDIGYDGVYTLNTCNVFEPTDYGEKNHIHIGDVTPMIVGQIEKIDQKYND
jgi:phosphoribosylpyrophosphate synthetase